MRADFEYAPAAVNLSHFYVYGRSFSDQLQGFDKDLLRQAAAGNETLSSFVKSLSHSNAIKMYVCIHLLAMDLAAQAGTKARQGDEAAAGFLQSAVLLNGFADHFLEDAFSAGHLVVNRTMLASFTNNKALHDFYSEHGTIVLNRKGEIWRAYGDGKFEADSPRAKGSLPPYSFGGRLVHGIFRCGEHPALLSFLDRIPDAKDQQPAYLLTHIPSLNLIPIPYNSKLQTIMPAGTVITDSMRKANHLLYYRNFIRSRIGNSFVIGQLNTVFRDKLATGFEFRANAVNFSRRYSYNAAGNKKGMLDYWHGYTVAYQMMQATKITAGIDYQVTAGIRSNFDYWLNDKKFLALYSYLETGLRFSNKKANIVLVPSLGISPGSLFHINYFDMPGWLRIPLMYLLPMKVRYGTVIYFNQPPLHHVGIELDLFF